MELFGAGKMNSFWNAWIARLRDPVTLATWFAISTLVALAGPFDTFSSMPPLLRIGFWGLLIGGAIVTVMFVCEVVKRATGEERTIGRDLRVAVIFSAIYGPVTWFGIETMGEPASDLHMPIWKTTAYVFLVCGLVLYLRRVLGVGDEPLPQEPLLVRRFEGLSAAEIARVSVRDHYVDVHTVCGASRSVLMRFSDALEELKGIEGLRTHRSHWVARSAVTGAERENGKVFLVTKDNARVPVSRGFLEEVQSAGLL